MTKSKSAVETTEQPAESTPVAKPPKQKTAAQVLASTLGMGVITAADLLKTISPTDQKKIVEIYYSDSGDKAVAIRQILEAKK